MLTIAIDPGASGGMAMKYDDRPAQAVKMETDPRAFAGTLRALIDRHYQVRVVMEDISHGIFIQGEADARLKVTSMSKLHRHCGQLEGVMAALFIEPEKVSPQKWMAKFAPLPKDQAERKRAIKALMEKEYPHLRVTLWGADALGILTYALAQKNS